MFRDHKSRDGSISDRGRPSQTKADAREQQLQPSPQGRAAVYRWVPEETFSQTPYIVYGHKYAIILWRPPVKIVLIQNAEIAESYRKQFKAHWRRGKVPPASS